jgi:hypothetical protein
VRFRDDSEQPYEPPKNTIDPRWEACTDHRTACDCREAEWNEEVQEYRAEYTSFRAALKAALVGHAACCCRCSGCAIARALHLTHLASGDHCS